MTRILISPERWRYNIGLITSTTLIAQLLTAANGQPIEPIEGIGEIKRELRSQDAKLSEKDAEIRTQAETIDIQQRKLDEERAKVSELQKEVERLNAEHDNRNISRGTSDMSTDSPDTVDNSNKSLEVEATFYSAFCSTGCSGITATGLDVRNTIYTPDGYRVIAVDPSVIALGSIVKVTLDNGDSFEAKAEDTGGDIRGNRIDILVESTDEAFSLGRQSASIEIISEGKR